MGGFATTSVTQVRSLVGISWEQLTTELKLKGSTYIGSNWLNLSFCFRTADLKNPKLYTRQKTSPDLLSVLLTIVVDLTGRSLNTFVHISGRAHYR